MPKIPSILRNRSFSCVRNSKFFKITNKIVIKINRIIAAIPERITLDSNRPNSCAIVPVGVGSICMINAAQGDAKNPGTPASFNPAEIAAFVPSSIVRLIAPPFSAKFSAKEFAISLPKPVSSNKRVNGWVKIAVPATRQTINSAPRTIPVKLFT